MILSRLSNRALEKVWGTPHTEPWHRNPEGRPIGEVWLEPSDHVPLLVKFLFTSDNLSVQVHPDDEYAQKNHGSRGKTEMWHILRAAPNAKIAIGLKESITPERLRESSVSGEIMDLLNWIPVSPGETYFVPAGTIHALGSDLAVCEIQQHSDVTYRLYDYGRPRELHLEQSMAVCCLDPHEGKANPVRLDTDRELLVTCPYFRTERWRVDGKGSLAAGDRRLLCIVLEGSGTIGGEAFAPGDAFEVEPRREWLEVSADRAVFLLTSEP